MAPRERASPAGVSVDLELGGPVPTVPITKVNKVVHGVLGTHTVTEVNSNVQRTGHHPTTVSSLSLEKSVIYNYKQLLTALLIIKVKF